MTIKKQIYKLAVEKLRNIKQQDTEADIELWVDHILLSIVEELNLPIKLSKEKGVKIETDYINKNGRIDTFLNGLVIEYKKIGEFNTEKDKKSAVSQAYKYISNLKKQNNKDYISYITDSKTVCRIDTYNVFDLNALVFKDVDANEITDIIYSASLSNDIRKATASNLVEDFVTDQSSPLYKINNLLYNLIVNDLKSETEDGNRTKCLFYEWKELFKLNDSGLNNSKSKDEVLGRMKDLSLKLQIVDKNVNIDNSEKEYMALFSLYTTYAITIKVVAQHILNSIHNNDKTALTLSIYDNNSDTNKCIYSLIKDIEDGKVFRDAGIFNLMEGDFFTWYVGKLQDETNKDLVKEIFSLIEIVKKYFFDFSYLKSNAIDMFRNLYETFIPFTVRHALGEYFTPLWLADFSYKQYLSTIKETNLNHRVIDNCCGSGAFVMTVINNKKNSKRSLAEILHEVNGIDINPLSALMGRVNYFLNIADLIKSEKDYIKNNPIVIPIYLADSCNIPKDVDGFLEYDLYLSKEMKEKLKINDLIKVKLPTRLLVSCRDRQASFFNKIDLFEIAIKNKSAECAVDVFKNDNLNQLEVEEIKSLANILIELEKHQWNGIWARIIANRLSTAMLGKFELILGNPPWVKWGDLPERYRNDLQDEARNNNLFNINTGHLGANSLNICSLIAYLSGIKYGKSGSKVVYLMPQDLLVQDSYEEWRKLGNGNMTLEYCVNWEKPSKQKKVFNDVSMPFMLYSFNVN